MPDSTEPKTLTLLLVWRDYPDGGAILGLGGLLDIGRVIFFRRFNMWAAIGEMIACLPSCNHPTREAAMEALEAAVKELELPLTPNNPVPIGRNGE